MFRRIFRSLASLLPAFAAGFAATAGGWAYHLRHNWPDWPGNRVAEYDRQSASGFPVTADLYLPDEFGIALNDHDVFVRLNTTRTPSHPDFKQPYARERGVSAPRAASNYPEGAVQLGGRRLSSVTEDLNARSRTYVWTPGLRWGGRFEARPHVRMAIDGSLPRAMTARIDYPDRSPEPRSSRIGLGTRLASSLERTPVLPSSALRTRSGASPETTALEKRLEATFRTAVTSKQMSEVALEYPSRNVAIQLGPAAGSLSAQLPARLGVLMWNHPRGQAAVADELRRLIVLEIVADVTLAGLGGGVASATLFAAGSALAAGIRRRRRRREGLCPQCGYDLRGSAHADRCPECGRIRNG